MGDFNEIISPNEQHGGQFSNTRAAAFATVMDECNLVDLEFFGSKFTWQKRCVCGGGEANFKEARSRHWGPALEIVFPRG